jgi:hypothetical protein
MQRRDFIAMIGSAVAAPATWPLAARAQQRELPLIDYLSLESP